MPLHKCRWFFLGGGAFLGSYQLAPNFPTSMQVSEVISLTYRQEPQVFVPANLVQQDGTGRKWLRLKPSSPAMAKLVLGHMVEFFDT